MKDKLLKYCTWAQIWRDENGQDLIEYALIVALISLAAITAMRPIGDGLLAAFEKIRDAFPIV